MDTSSLRKPPSASSASGGSDLSSPAAAVPTLRVMRLQSPELHVSTLGGGPHLTEFEDCCLRTSLCLPDSLVVYVGERFVAYLGILNGSTNGATVRKLTVTAQLQTPTARWQLPTGLEPRDVPPGMGVDTIVNHDIEEPGQHILRVEVGYAGSDGGGTKTFRKFYRFNVVSPLSFRTFCGRLGDSTCYVSLSVEHGNSSSNASGAPDSGTPSNNDPLVLASVEFSPADGLAAEAIGIKSAQNDGPPLSPLSALELLDQAEVLAPGGSRRYLFRISAESKDAILRGIASGDLLGRFVVTWRKAMGETGRVSSSAVHCPPISPSALLLSASDGDAANFVVHHSGLSVDVAASAAAAAQSRTIQQPTGSVSDPGDLSRRLAVTVEPIDPPRSMRLLTPRRVQLLVVNHSTQPMTLQVRFFETDSRGSGIVPCGTSFQTLDNVPPNGGSTVVTVTLLAMSTGLLTVGGCRAVDLASGREIVQPPLFRVLVEGNDDMGKRSVP